MRELIKTAINGLSVSANRIAISANIAGTLVVLALVGVVNYDIVARGLFNAPFRGAVEVVQFSIVLIVFLQLPDVVRVNRLTHSDGFQLLIGPRFPRFTRFLRHAINLLSAVFMAIVAVAIFPEFTNMWRTQDYFGVPGVFTAPWWPLKLAILFAATLSAVIFALKILVPSDAITLVRLPESEEISK